MISPTVLFAAIVGFDKSLQILRPAYIMNPRAVPGMPPITVVMTLYEAVSEDLRSATHRPYLSFCSCRPDLTAHSSGKSGVGYYSSAKGRSDGGIAVWVAVARSRGTVTHRAGAPRRSGKEARWKILAGRGGRGIEWSS